MVSTCNPSSRGVETGGSKFEASLGFVMRPCQESPDVMCLLFLPACLLCAPLRGLSPEHPFPEASLSCHPSQFPVTCASLAGGCLLRVLWAPEAGLVCLLTSVSPASVRKSTVTSHTEMSSDRDSHVIAYWSWSSPPIER